MIRFRISELLGKHKMTQKDLAEKTGIRPATVSALYHDKIKRLEVEHIESLCRVFNCQPGDLMEYIPDKKEEKDE
jgi:putative transcriptional regulator